MILQPYIFRRVTIIGVGLMGGSLGMAMKKHRLAREVVGVSHHQSSLVNAIKEKAIDIAEMDIPKAVRNSDLVVLATPVDSIKKLLASINPHLRRGCFVTDLGSTKLEIVEAAQKHLSNPTLFVGSHPLAGSDKQGVDNANADLFQNASCIMTPLENTHQAVKKRIKLLWTGIGAEVKFLSPQEHDEMLAYVSHLPHLLAYSLMETIPEKSLEFGSTGLKDMTRIASSSPRMWSEICTTNTKNIVRTLDALVKHLAEIRKDISSKNINSLSQRFTTAKNKRDAFK